MGPPSPTLEEPDPITLAPIEPVDDGEEDDTYQQVLSTYSNSRIYTVLPYTELGSQEEFHDPSHLLSLAERLKEVVAAQGPVHIDEAFRDVARCWAFNTLGRKIKRQLTHALAHINATERPIKRGDVWLWPTDLDPATWQEFRIPGDEARSFRKAEHIAPEEFAIASRAILKRAIGSMRREDLARATAHLFGIRRMGPRVREHVGLGVALIIDSGEAVLRGDEVTLV